MAEHRAPGVHIEEAQVSSSPIQGVSTSTVGFVAVTGRGFLLGPLFSFLDFERVATPHLGVNLPLAVRGFFENGGQRCFISQIATTDSLESGLAALDAQAISIICCPDDATILNSAAAMASHCQKRKDRLCILQSPQPIVPLATHQPPVQSSYAAYYYPWLTVRSLDGSSTVTVPPRPAMWLESTPRRTPLAESGPRLPTSRWPELPRSLKTSRRQTLTH